MKENNRSGKQATNKIIKTFKNTKSFTDVISPMHNLDVASELYSQ